MGPRNLNHCRLPQRADLVAGVESVAGLTPISAVPDPQREEAVKNVLQDEARASRMQKKVKKLRGSEITKLGSDCE